MQTRRELVAGAAGAMALLAGCQGAPGESSGTSTGTDETPTADGGGPATADTDETTDQTEEPTERLDLEPGVSGVGTDVARWIPAQSVPAYVSRVTEPETGAYYFTAIDVPAILAYEDALGTPQGDQSIFDPATSEGQAGVDLTESLYVKAGPTDAPYFYVFDGGVERSTRVETLTENPSLSETGTVDGYTIVAAEDAGGYAVGESTQVAARYVTNGGDVVRSAIRTDAPKYAAESEPFGRVLAALGAGEAVGGFLQPDEDVAGLLAYGRALSYGSETTTRRYASVFDPETASVAEVESFTESQFAESPRLRTGQGLVVAERTVATAEVGYPTHTDL